MEEIEEKEGSEKEERDNTKGQRKKKSSRTKGQVTKFQTNREMASRFKDHRVEHKILKT